MRDQAITNRRRVRRRKTRSASSVDLRRRGRDSLLWILRAVPGLIYVSLLILSAWLLYYSIASPYFSVHEIAVSGSKLLDEDTAREAAGALGHNVLLLKSSSIEESVRAISAVKDARVSLGLPGRVEIDVTERTPLVQWQAREGSFLIDREGVVFSRAAASQPLTVIRSLDGLAMDVGSRVDPAVLEDVKTLETALPAGAGIQPRGFDYSRTAGLSVTVDGGARIVFGDAGGLDSKMANLAAIRAHLDTAKARAEVIDLRFTGRPVYVLASTAPTKPSQNR